ncbi:MAG: DNA-binding protein [Thermoprotei archaeon]|nr:MAG: DNA-binding protein [Thermoprotei archaeon]
MRNTDMAASYVRQAEERLHHAREALERGSYPYVIRQCQEAVELLLKAALRLVGVEPPRWHDVGPVLRREAQRFPHWFRRDVAVMARYSRRLRREREPSMYGDEETGLPPEAIYDYEDAREALEMAEYVYERVKKLLDEYPRT